MNMLVDFVLNKNDRGREKITPEKHPRRVVQGHKLAALMKKKEKKRYCITKNSLENSL